MLHGEHINASEPSASMDLGDDSELNVRDPNKHSLKVLAPSNLNLDN